MSRLSLYLSKIAEELSYPEEPPRTYAGAGLKTGLSSGALISAAASYKGGAGIKASGKAGLFGAAMWGAIGGIGGGLLKRRSEFQQ